MEGGDLGVGVVPRLVIVWENLLGLLPDKTAEAKVATYLRFRRWKRAVNVFELNEPLSHRIWDVTWRLNFEVDVLTYINSDFAKAVEDRIERDDLPVRRVWHAEPNILARKLAYMPQVARIYDPNPSHRFLYGAKTHILSPATPDLLGAF